MEKLMNKIMKRFGAVCISIFMVFTLCMPCFADETQKTIRVGSFEDTFNYVDDHGVRRGYGYELMQALAGYTGWKFEYVKCDWSNCFDKLENGEIDIMGDIAYTDDRAKEMLFSEETMGEEKYVLYANLSDTDILSSDYKSLDGKRIGVLKGTEPEYMLTEWENKYGIHTEHVNVSGNEDVKKKLENNEIDCFVSLEESIWSERGISSVTTIGKSDIYFAINKERSDIKQELDYAMRQLDSDSPFYKADLYKKYFTLDYTQFLTGNEKSWLEEHGGIRIGFLDNDPVVFSMDKKSGEIRGSLPEYISYAKDCLGNHTLKFDIQAFDDYDKMIEALQNKEIDVIYYVSRNSNVAEKKGYALSNTAWTYNLIAVTNKEDFNENDSYVVAVPKNKVALKQHIAYNYPHWKLVDCDSIDDGANMVVDGKVDCFIKGSSQVLKFDGHNQGGVTAAQELYENNLITDLDTAAKVYGNTEKTAVYQDATFFVKGNKDLDQVIKNLRKLDINWNEYVLVKSTSNYPALQKSIRGMYSVANKMFIGSLIFAGIVVTLLLFMWMNARRKEIAILMALGISKMKIFIQFALELCMVTIPAYIFAYFIAGKTASSLGTKVLNNVSTGVAKEIAKESASNQLGGGAEVDGFNKMLTHIDATVEPKYMMYVIIFMSIVMLIALVVSTTHLLNKNCKELMNEEEV